VPAAWVTRVWKEADGHNRYPVAAAIRLYDQSSFQYCTFSSLQLVFPLRVSDSHIGPFCRCISPAHPLGADSVPAEQAANPVRSIRRHKVENSTAIAGRQVVNLSRHWTRVREKALL
jgi:hypothetical protein